MLITARTSQDLRFAVNLFAKNKNDAKLIKRIDKNTVLLYKDGECTGRIILTKDKASIINTNNMSFTCTKVHQPKTYSKVNEMFVELAGIFSGANGTND